MQFEPEAIRFNVAAMSTVGGSPFLMEMAAPDLEGTFRLASGVNSAYGTVRVPLDASERVLLRQIIESASRRAAQLEGTLTNRVGEARLGMGGRPSKQTPADKRLKENRGKPMPPQKPKPR